VQKPESSNIPPWHMVPLGKTISDEEESTLLLFHRLTDQWRRETRHMSSVHDIIMHPAYQQIIGLGEKAIPLILNELRERLDHWFWALMMITRESPVPQEEYGKMTLMRDIWLEWGKRKGYINQ